MSVGGFKDAQDTLRTYWSSNWPGKFTPSIPSVWENQIFDGAPDQDYVEFIVRETDSIPLTCGPVPRRWRVLGSIIVFIRGRVDSGAGQVRVYADAAAALFRGVKVDTISFIKAPRVVVVGLDESRYRINLIAPFQFDIFA